VKVFVVEGFGEGGERWEEDEAVNSWRKVKLQIIGGVVVG
jgi:hypothetical protein